MQLASYLEGGLLMWMMPLHVNQKSDNDDDAAWACISDSLAFNVAVPFKCGEEIRCPNI